MYTIYCLYCYLCSVTKGYDTNYAGPPPSSSEYSEVSSDYNAHSNYAHSSDGKFHLCNKCNYNIYCEVP